MRIAAYMCTPPAVKLALQAWLLHTISPSIWRSDARACAAGHFHLSHNYADSIAVAGHCAFVQTGVIGDCNRDGFRHSRVLKGMEPKEEGKVEIQVTKKALLHCGRLPITTTGCIDMGMFLLGAGRQPSWCTGRSARWALVTQDLASTLGAAPLLCRQRERVPAVRAGPRPGNAAPGPGGRTGKYGLLGPYTCLIDNPVVQATRAGSSCTRWTMTWARCAWTWRLRGQIRRPRACSCHRTCCRTPRSALPSCV